MSTTNIALDNERIENTSKTMMNSVFVVKIEIMSIEDG